MTDPIRLTVVMTHPVQYYSPWFRHIAADCPSLSLTVVYAIRPNPTQQGTGFGQGFEWDTSLIEGYHSQVVREARKGDRIGAGNVFGVDVSEIGDAVLRTAPEVVVVPGWNSATLVRAAAACRKRGIPVIYRGDSQLGMRRNFLAVTMRSAKTRLMLRLFSHYLAVGQRSREYLKHFGASDERIFFSPHCVDNDFFARSAAPFRERSARTDARLELGIPTDAFVVLYLGKLEAKKRPLDAIAAVGALGSGAILLVVGSGHAEAQCRDAALRQRVNCVFPGFRNQSALGRFYAISDCLALPSDHRETWGLVVNEAMATGLPCVVSDAAGCAPDMIVAGKTGYSYPLADLSALSAALDSVRTALNTGQDFSAACRDRAARYSIPAATAGLLTACSSAVRTNQGEGSRAARHSFATVQRSGKSS